ncbi:MAG: NADH-quinone oxidoreductase subunit C [Afipia sp.]
MDDARLNALGETIVAALPGAALGHSVAFNQLTVSVDLAKIVDIARVLKTDPRFRFVNVTDVTAVDYPGRENRFDVIYNFLSPVLNTRVRLRGEANETTQVPSIISVFPGSDWFERETYDLYGVIFVGHPDMRRLLTDYGFDGHPLRKDFPLTGFVEVRYDDAEKRVVYEPVRLNQEFRKFDFLSPWEGADYALPGDEKAEAPPAPKAGG